MGGAQFGCVLSIRVYQCTTPNGGINNSLLTVICLYVKLYYTIPYHMSVRLPIVNTIVLG